MFDIPAEATITFLIVYCKCVFWFLISSSLSSGINAMAANTIEDILVNYLQNASQWTQTLAAKFIGG